jgi:hypothetical protein
VSGQGYDIPPANDDGSSDPFCIVLFGNKKVKSVVRKQTCFPQWCVLWLGAASASSCLTCCKNTGTRR